MKDHGGLRSWLQRYPSHFAVSGQPGRESVTLILGAHEHPWPGSEDVEHPPDAAAMAAPAAVPPPATMHCSTHSDVVGEEANRSVVSFDEEIDGQRSIELRGLPYQATAEDVLTFLGDF
eukprot:817043-Prorocentrum_lima.AAC.1